MNSSTAPPSGPVLVVGAAASGIGTACSQALLESGSTVFGIIEPGDDETAKKLVSQYGDRFWSVEIKEGFASHSSRQSAIRAINDRLQRSGETLGGIVNAHLYFHMESPEAIDYSLWARGIEENLAAPHHFSRALRPSLEPGSGIVIITSTEAFVGSFGASSYAAAKAAVHNLVQSLANSFGSYSVRVNALAAGWIGGVMDTDEVFEMSKRITPLARLGTPEEVAAVAKFLLSKDAGFVNGSVVTVDGGYSGVDTIAKYEFEAAQDSLGG